MDLKKKGKQSTLKQADSTLSNRLCGIDAASKPKRRISFSGRKSVREFHAEEKPKSWNNSYEISDNNSLENVSIDNTKEVLIPILKYPNLLGCKENISIQANGTKFEDRYPQNENQKKFALSLFQTETRAFNRQPRDFTSDASKENTRHLNETILCDEKYKDVIERREGITNDTYYGNRLSLLQCTDMDITKHGEHSTENATNHKIVNMENLNKGPIQAITQSFSKELEETLLQSMDCDCDLKTILESEKIKRAEGSTSFNIDVPMDISMQLNESFKCAGLFQCTSRSKFFYYLFSAIICNSNEELKNTPETASSGHGQYKNNTNTPKVVVLRKLCTPTKNIMNDVIPKQTKNQSACEEPVATPKSHGHGLNVYSLSNIGFNVDFYSSQCILSPSVSCDSPLFPPTKSKNLNFRQLNAEIGNGKRVVFPNKNVKDRDVTFSESNINTSPNAPNNESQRGKKTQLSKHGEEENNGISAELKLNGMCNINTKNNITYSECEDILTESTSFLVKEKVGDETILGNTLQLSDEFRKNTIHFNSEIDTTISPKVTYVGPLREKTEVEYVTEDLNIITLDTPKSTSYLSSTKTKALGIIKHTPSQHCDDECNTLRRSIYMVHDMSLNNTNIELMSSVPPQCVKTEVSEINATSSRRIMKFDITPRNILKLDKKRKTIYFNDYIESLNADSVSVLDTETLTSKCNDNAQGDVESKFHEVNCTPIPGRKGRLVRQIDVDISSDSSFILNLREARAALSSNRKRQFEGTPHRSFLEFVSLEKQVEQGQICLKANTIEGGKEPEKLVEAIQNETQEEYNCLDGNEMSFRENEEKIKKNEMENECGETPEHEAQGVLRKPVETFSEIRSLDVSGLTLIESDRNENSLIRSPIFNSGTNKRLTENLTSNFPLPKKRQTLILTDCEIHEATICSESMTLKNLSNNFKGEADIIKDKFPESYCREPCAENQNVINSNELKYNLEDKYDPVNEDINSEEAFIGYQNEKMVSESNEYLPNISGWEMDGPILSNSNTAKRNESGIMEYSVDTIQLPRRAVTFNETRSSIIKLPLETQDTTEENVVEKYKNIEYAFEDNPITISDVSVHYLAQKKPSIVDNIGFNVQQSCSGDSNKTAVFNKEFINLERENSPLCISEMDDIDKTRLSLVETLLSENEDINDEEPYQKESEKELSINQNCVTTTHNLIESCSASLGVKGSNIDAVAKVQNTTLCHRCKRCQEALSPEGMSATTESFALPSMPPLPSLGLENLERLRKRPKLKDVHEYWRRRSLEKKEANTAAFAEKRLDNSIDEKNSDCVSRTHINDFKDSVEVLKEIEKQINELKIFAPLQTDIFYKNLSKMLIKVLPNWVLNYQMIARGIIQFSHKKCISFAIEMLCEDRNQLGNQFSIQDISLQSSRIKSKLWKPIDHLLDSNLKTRLSFGLKPFYSGNADEKFVLGLLQSVDEVCTQALKDCLNLWRLICSEEAALIRESSRVIVRKIIREVAYEGVDHYPVVKNTEFQIELNNIQTVSFKDIISPPLYAFSEELQFLPSGIDFLRVFLKSPCSYLRPLTK
ncbi:uncharacterized protein LOC128871888 isoform X2 [Anastrepha ludens]|uniref:uncharacterized protein LOC128871888 isoform X2 n=1 Tax=Anastrepha ludens TaxID=28586 RepID=UPI0023AE7CA0|nr:uncharacterized protein LOC128871888 isoform X2 [Anastrepha ludens]